ncbi:hypothetical protein LGQ02_05195 [Bacillus shivajii]|uniref:hypothetical protein n=1 Tax=Bacillus shivajii TaxID=1983719 RepID=UPI001CFBC01A|nr:hypothetical protein [Bacillus shivajii]UCZ54160.1 hypothetical protein LGQ02_05195 [Bacillus shivajii]
MEFELKVKNLTKDEKKEYIVAFTIIAISIIVGIFVGQNEEWFRPANFSAGYMSGSLLTGVILFSLYRFVDFLIEKMKKKST